VPAFNIDGRFIVGFDRARLEGLLLGKIVECPECRTKHRAPREKGRIRITCSNCGTKFDVMT
jgi:glutaredoxin 3